MSNPVYTVMLALDQTAENWLQSKIANKNFQDHYDALAADWRYAFTLSKLFYESSYLGSKVVGGNTYYIYTWAVDKRHSSKVDARIDRMNSVTDGTVHKVAVWNRDKNKLITSHTWVTALSNLDGDKRFCYEGLTLRDKMTHVRTQHGNIS